MTLHIMSDKELTRLKVLRDLTSGRLTASPAAKLLGLERRQIHARRRPIRTKVQPPSSRRSAADRATGRCRRAKVHALEIIRERYADFGPTLAAEKLSEVHGITIGRETLRLWMPHAGLWADRVKRRGRANLNRYAPVRPAGFTSLAAANTSS